MDPLKNPQLWLAVLALLWNCALTAALWLRKPGVDAGKAVDELRGRLTTIEAHMQHMPTNEELATLEGMVKQLNERTEGLSEAISTVRTQLNRIENYLLTPK